MPGAFKKFGPGDQIDNILILEPKYELASGTNGWRGSPNGSASLSLYGGPRRKDSGIFTEIKYQSLVPNAFQIDVPTLGQPLTASVNVVWMTNEELTLSTRSSTRWGKEHWDTVQRLYTNYSYRDADFVTSSYDFYCLYFQKDSLNVVIDNVRSSATTFPLPPSASFTIESWIKPFITSSTNSDFTIQSWNQSFWFGITGSNGMLKFSSSLGQSSTSSIGTNVGLWNHAAFVYDSSTKTGSFYVNLQLAGTFTSPSASITSNVTSSTFFSVGNQIANDTVGFNSCVARAKTSFHGFIGETRYWESARSFTQLSGAANCRLIGTDAGAPLAVLMFNEGPLATVAAFAMGSGVLDSAGLLRTDRVSFNSGKLVGFDDRSGPTWHPNDNVNFYPYKSQVSVLPSSSISAVNRMIVVDIPSAFYGRQIVPNSISLTCRAYSSSSYGLVRTLIDDGRGGLFLSGTAFSGTFEKHEDYRGVEWNKVGNVFYGEGLIIIKDPSLLDFGGNVINSTQSADTSNLFQLTFRGTSRVPVKTLMCRIDRGEFNCSSNPTFSTVESDGMLVRTNPSGSIRVSTVGLYNTDRELVGVAKLADPVRIRARDRINIKLRMDF